MSEQPDPAAPLEHGRYRLLERIGAGSMMEVFKAKSFGVEGFEKLLVIKRLLAELAADREFLRAFVEQAKLSVRLCHANVVQVFDLGRFEESFGPSCYLATEYVAGVSLARLLAALTARGDRLPVPVACYVALELARALDHAHRRRDEAAQLLGIVHGDLRPNNVLLSWDGEVKLSDFCLARALHAVDRPGAQAARTARRAYASPEIAAGRPGDARSDVFSLGVVLYEALHGARPFAADGALALGEPSIEPALAAVLRRALQPEPGARQPSAADFHEELIHYVHESSQFAEAAELVEVLERACSEPLREAARFTARSLFDPAIDDSVPPQAAAPGWEPAAEPVESAEPVGREASVLALQVASDSLGALARARVIIARYGGRVLREHGSEILAAFGLDQDDGRDTQNAVRCGLVLLSRLANASPQAGVDRAEISETPGGRISGATWLDPGVQNARLLSHVSNDGVLIAERAVPKLRGLFVMEPIGSLPTSAYRIAEARAPSAELEPFVGRKAELARLGELLARASSKRLTAVGLVGPRGVGKTRLLLETEARLRQRAFNVGFYSVSCPPRGREQPLSALGTMLRALCGVHDGDPRERIAEVEPRLRALGMPRGEVHVVLDELARAPGSAPLASEVLYGAVGRMFHSLSEDRLHIFAWDDAEELDDQSASALAQVSTRFAQARMLLVFAARPTREAGYRRIPGYVQIDVNEPDAGGKA